MHDKDTRDMEEEVEVEVMDMAVGAATEPELEEQVEQVLLLELVEKPLMS